MEKIKFNKAATQGELLVMRCEKPETDLVKAKPDMIHFIIGHSETGHHHVVETTGTCFYETENPMIAFLEVFDAEAELKHLRSYDTHPSLMLDKGWYEIRRQREPSPTGWKKVID
jgi:hypothetical protein